MNYGQTTKSGAPQAAGTYAHPQQPTYAPGPVPGYGAQPAAYHPPPPGPAIVIQNSSSSSASASASASAGVAPGGAFLYDDGCCGGSCCSCGVGACCAFAAHRPLADRRYAAYSVILVALVAMIALGATLNSPKFVSLDDSAGRSFFGPMKYQGPYGDTGDITDLITLLDSRDGQGNSGRASDLKAAHGSATAAIVFGALAGFGAIVFLLVPASSPAAMAPVWLAAMGLPAFLSFLCAVIMQCCFVSFASSALDDVPGVDEWQAEPNFFLWTAASIFMLLATSLRSCYTRCCCSYAVAGQPAVAQAHAYSAM